MWGMGRGGKSNRFFEIKFYIPVTGTLGVLMKAKQKGYLSELNPVLDVMVQKGIYIKPSLVELCLKQVGETDN